MSYPKPIRLDGLTAKVETTEGTDASPAAADDGVRLAERVWSSIQRTYAFPNRRDDVANGSLEVAKPGPRAGEIVNLEIAWEARGIGSAYSSSDVPEASPLIQACGWSETVDDTAGSETVTYASVDEDIESCTIYAYAGGKLYKIVGCRGNMRWPVTAGELGILRFEMQGLVDEITETSLPSITYDSQLPAAAKGMTVTVGGWSPDVLTSEFDRGAQMQRLDAANASDAVDGFHPSAFTPSYSLSARAVALSTYNPYTSDDGETSAALVQNLGTGGDSSSYNRIKLAATLYLEEPGHNDDNGFAAWDLTYQVVSPTVVFD